MKLKKARLRQIIKEELQKIAVEKDVPFEMYSRKIRSFAERYAESNNLNEKVEDGKNRGGWSREVYSDYVIYQAYAAIDFPDTLYKLSYSVSDSGEPKFTDYIKVEEIVTYVPIGTSGEQSTDDSEEQNDKPEEETGSKE